MFLSEVGLRVPEEFWGREVIFNFGSLQIKSQFALGLQEFLNELEERLEAQGYTEIELNICFTFYSKDGDDPEFILYVRSPTRRIDSNTLLDQLRNTLINPNNIIFNKFLTDEIQIRSKREDSKN